MEYKFENDVLNIKEQEWDSNYFGVNCAKIELLKTVDDQNWSKVIDMLDGYDFVTIIIFSYLDKFN